MRQLKESGAKGGIYKLILALPLAWQISFYCIPLIFVVVMSFWVLREYQLTAAFTLQSYRLILRSSVYTDAVWTSVWFSSMTAIVATILAFPLSYAVTFHVSNVARRLLIVSLFIPYLSNYLIRVSSWQLWLNDNGIFAYALRHAGITANLSLSYTPIATTIGLLSILIPIASLIIHLSLAQIDKSLISAARNLGATPSQTLLRVELPLAVPGIAVSLLLTFILAFGDFVSVSVLGGGKTPTLSTLIIDRVKIGDWPTAGALGVIMLVISVLCILIMGKCVESLLPRSKTSRPT